MKVRYTATAVSDIDQIYRYVLERNPRAATAIVDAIEETAARLGLYPYSAPAADEPNIRMAPTRRYPYMIFYRISADAVEIIRVRHTARRRPWDAPQNETDES